MYIIDNSPNITSHNNNNTNPPVTNYTSVTNTLLFPC